MDSYPEFNNQPVNSLQLYDSTNLSFGTGEAGGASHLSPAASNCVRAEATDLAAGVGAVGVGIICCVRLCLTGEPTHNFTNSPNSSARARPSRDDADNKGLICLI